MYFGLSDGSVSFCGVIGECGQRGRGSRGGKEVLGHHE